MTQLDIFSDYKPKARVYQFPADRMVSDAHQIAARLYDLDYGDGKSFWAHMCRKLANGLRKDGCSKAEIAAATEELAEQVHQALRTIHIQKQYRAPGVILSLTGARIETVPHGDGAGAAGALGQGTKFLAGFGVEPHEEPTEFGTSRARDGGAA